LQHAYLQRKIYSFLQPFTSISSHLEGNDSSFFCLFLPSATPVFLTDAENQKSALHL